MENVGVKVLFASVAASFAAGFGMAWYLKPPADPVAIAAMSAPAAGQAPALRQFGTAAPAALRPAVGTAAPSPQAGLDELWKRALAPQDKQEPGYAAEDRLRQLVQADPTALRKLLQRYDTSSTPQERELLKSILSTVQTPEVIAFSSRLAGSLNAAERKYGFEMLQTLAPDAPETRSLVKRTLASEQSPEVLVQALATLKPGATDNVESSAMVAQLKTLSTHADSAVRSMSLTQLGQWDKTGEGGERMGQALSDRAPEVRQAAVFAIAQAGLRSEPLKAGLLALVNNPQESRDVRGSALQVLERFPLTKEEVALLAQARGRIQGM